MCQELARPQFVSGRLAVQPWSAKLGAVYLPGPSHKVDCGNWLMSGGSRALRRAQGSEKLVWLAI